MANDIIGSLANLMVVLGGIGAAVAFIVSFRQYKKGQNWLRAKVVISLIDSFERDEQIELACTMLDWDEREIVFPGGKSVKFSNDILVSALRVPEMDVCSSSQEFDTIEEPPFTEEESMIRDAFDCFFDFFHKLYSLEKGKLLSFSDYVYFYYWLELVRDIGVYKKDERIKKALFNYIDCYRFTGIKELLKEYEKKPDIIPIMKSQGSKPT